MMYSTIKTTHMKSKNTHFSTLFVLSLCLLSACGGGTSSDQNSSSTAQVMPDQVIPAALQQAIPANYPANSQQSQILTAINGYRLKMGLGPLNQNTYLDQAAANHQVYLSQSWINGIEEYAAAEIAGRTGFTGTYPLDRAKAAGWEQASEVLESQIYGVVDFQSNSSTRQYIMNETITDVGIAANTNGITILEFGYAGSGQTNASDYIGTYPINGETEIPITSGYLMVYKSNIAPDACTTNSYPISLQSQISTYLTLKSFTVRESGSTVDLPAYILRPGSSAYPHEAFWVGNAPFKPYTTYNVHFIGRVGGGKAGTGFLVDKSWNFTTGKNYPPSCPQSN